MAFRSHRAIVYCTCIKGCTVSTSSLPSQFTPKYWCSWTVTQTCFRNEPPYLSTFAAVSRGCVWITPSRGTHAAVIWTRVTSSGAAFLTCSFHFWDGVCLQPPTARVGGLCNCLQFPERSYPHGTENVSRRAPYLVESFLVSCLSPFV